VRQRNRVERDRRWRPAATVYYGVCGEGRGHATRARAIVEELRRNYRVRVFAAGDAHDLLRPEYAGNQIVGEARALGKPVFGVPEHGNFEQEINAFFIGHSGCGESAGASEVTTARLRRFFERAESYRSAPDPEAAAGNGRAVDVLRRYLPAPRPAAAPAEPARRVPVSAA